MTYVDEIMAAFYDYDASDYKPSVKQEDLEKRLSGIIRKAQLDVLEEIYNEIEYKYRVWDNKWEANVAKKNCEKIASKINKLKENK